MEVLPVNLSKNGHVRYFGIDVAVDSGHVKISIQVFSEEQLHTAVNSAYVDSLLSQSRYRHLDAPVDPRDIRKAHRLRDLDFAVYAVQFHRAVDFADSYSPVDTTYAEVNLPRQRKHHSLTDIAIAPVIVLTANDQAARSLLHKHLAEFKVFARARGSVDVDLRRAALSGFDVY